MKKSRSLVTLAAMLSALSGAASLCAGEQAFVIPAPEVDNPKAAGPEQTAVLAGGCFWGVQGVFQHLGGVKRVLSGYAGGDKRTAHYEVVSRGDTGHAESVEVVFDPKVVSYGEILQVSSPSHTTRRSSTGRAPTQERSIVPQSSTRTNSRRRSPPPTSRSSTRRRCIATRSSPRWTR